MPYYQLLSRSHLYIAHFVIYKLHFFKSIVIIYIFQ